MQYRVKGRNLELGSELGTPISPSLSKWLELLEPEFPHLNSENGASFWDAAMGKWERNACGGCGKSCHLSSAHHLPASCHLFKKFLFILYFGCLWSSLLHWSSLLRMRGRGGGAALVAVHGFRIERAFFVAQHVGSRYLGFSSCGA